MGKLITLLRIPENNFVERFCDFLSSQKIGGRSFTAREVVQEFHHDDSVEYHAKEHSLDIAPDEKSVAPFRADFARVYYDNRGPLYPEFRVDMLLAAQMRKFWDKLASEGFEAEFFNSEGLRIGFVDINGQPCCRIGEQEIYMGLERAMDQLESLGLGKHEYIIIGSEGPHPIIRK